MLGGDKQGKGTGKKSHVYNRKGGKVEEGGTPTESRFNAFNRRWGLIELSEVWKDTRTQNFEMKKNGTKEAESRQTKKVGGEGHGKRKKKKELDGGASQKKKKLRKTAGDHKKYCSATERTYGEINRLGKTGQKKREIRCNAKKKTNWSRPEQGLPL